MLLVVRDRTEELRREEAEREFVSNAAHELRNPIAGMSGAIEVLRSGAKDDPEARDHFLDRLATDVERVTPADPVAADARPDGGDRRGRGRRRQRRPGAPRRPPPRSRPPTGVELEPTVERDLVAEADPVLLRQVLIGLLTNAFKHTRRPGTVTLRAYAEGEEARW